LTSQREADADIKESTAATFMKDVIEASRERPVLVDFWAPWCGPCQQLTPILEKIVTEAKGRLSLVKINVEAQQALAQQMGVQSVPMVYLFSQGQPVDGFAGAMPESQVRAFCQPWLAAETSPIDALIEQAHLAQDAEDWHGARAHYDEAQVLAPEDPRVLLGLALCAVRLGDVPSARDLWATIPAVHQDSSAGRLVRAALQLAEQSQQMESDQEQQVQAALAANPHDPELRFTWAMACVARQDYETAVDQLLQLVVQDLEWSHQKARKQLVTMFESLGFEHPVSVKGRKQLAKILFS
jgi:putative thioredoxin